jgi:hypothetical protein
VTTAIAANDIEVQLVEQEHHRIHEGLSKLEDAIGRAHLLTRSTAIDSVVGTLTWLRRDVMPHAAWEEAWLYPRLDALAETPWATRAMRFEHEQIRELATLLERDFLAAEAPLDERTGIPARRGDDPRGDAHLRPPRAGAVVHRSSARTRPWLAPRKETKP